MIFKILDVKYLIENIATVLYIVQTGINLQLNGDVTVFANTVDTNCDIIHIMLCPTIID